MRFAAGIEYDGSDYFGWQSQQGLPTIQDELERAFSYIADEKIEVIAAGRTDKGVHATGQIIHFDAQSERQLQAWTLGANSYLSNAIAVRWVKPVAHDFHARFSALARGYRYIIYNHSLRPALNRQRVAWYYRPLAIKAMQEASQYLLGTHDFSAFRTVACQAKSPIRTIQSLELQQIHNLIILDIRADGFLHHMVRNIVGVLLAIGSGQYSPNWVMQVLQSKDRRQGGITAAASGLYLTHIEYPERFAIPNYEVKIIL